MFITFVFYFIMVTVDISSIVFYPSMLMVKDLESPLYLVLELFGLILSDTQLAQNTRFKIDIEEKGCKCAKYVVIVIEKILMYVSWFYMFNCLLQLNIAGDKAFVMLVGILGAFIVVLPIGFFFRQTI